MKAIICCLSQDGSSCFSHDSPSAPEISVAAQSLPVNGEVLAIGEALDIPSGARIAATPISTDVVKKRTPVATAETLISRDAFANQTTPVAGTYIVTHEDLPVTLTKERASKEICKLSLNTRVNVVEIGDASQQRIRGRIDIPAGWITLQSADTMIAFVELLQPKTNGFDALETTSPKTDSAKRSKNILEASTPPPPPPHTIVPPLNMPTQQSGGSSAKVGGSIQKVDESRQQVDHAESDGPSLNILFWHKGEETLVRFKRQPLGLQWRTKAPLAVEKVLPGSEAEEHGVKIGWQIRMIGDIDLTGQSFGVISNTLKEALRPLPWEDGVTKSQASDGFKPTLFSRLLQ